MLAQFHSWCQVDDIKNEFFLRRKVIDIINQDK